MRAGAESLCRVDLDVQGANGCLAAQMRAMHKESTEPHRREGFPVQAQPVGIRQKPDFYSRKIISTQSGDGRQRVHNFAPDRLLCQNSLQDPGLLFFLLENRNSLDKRFKSIGQRKCGLGGDFDETCQIGVIAGSLAGFTDKTGDELLAARLVKRNLQLVPIDG